MLIYLDANNTLTVTVPTGAVPIADLITQLVPEGRVVLDVDPANVPATPIETWVVDWDTGTITLDPSWEPVQPPDKAGGWAALITSALYQRVYLLGQSHLAIAAELGIFGTAYNTTLLDDAQWTGSVSAIANRLAAMINATEAPLTLDEVAWLQEWNGGYHLGLTLEVSGNG